MKWYTLSEAANMIGYASGQTLRFYIKLGLVKAKKMGSVWIINDKEIAKRKEIHDKFTAKA